MADEPKLVPLSTTEVELPEGFVRMQIEVEPGLLTSIVVFGNQDALLHFSIDPVRVVDALDEDGLLPRVASFVAPEGVRVVTVNVELKEPGKLARVAAERVDKPPTDGQIAPLIGLPSPSRRDDGYLIGRSGRYQFARPDVIVALVDAFRETRQRFRRDPIAVADITQWNGRRPAIDVGKPRHVSHEGGRDVDIALPSLEEPSTMRDHCEKVLNEAQTEGVCRPGTSQALDAARLAYLLGKLIKHGTVEKVFLDREFIDEVARASKRLVKPKVFPAWVAERLQPDAGVLRHVAWHTDHVHVRFVGAKGETTVTY